MIIELYHTHYMSPFGHLAVTYIIIRLMEAIFHASLSPADTIVILVAASIIDVDYLIGLVFGKKGQSHHAFLTHTPFALFLLFIGVALLFFPQHGMIIWATLLISLLTHLVLDELQYILYRLGIQPNTPYQQIAWLWPFQQHAEKKETRMKKHEAKDAKVMFLIEGVCISVAVIALLADL